MADLLSSDLNLISLIKAAFSKRIDRGEDLRESELIVNFSRAIRSYLFGTGELEETVFENRFQHVDELKKMGADISLEKNKASIKGVSNLFGAVVSASDLRASASLVLAGLVGKNRTQIEDIYHIDRGLSLIHI